MTDALPPGEDDEHRLTPVRAPMPAPHDPIWALRREPLLFFLELSRRFGDVVQYRAAPNAAFLLNHPDHLKHVLSTHAERYRKDTLAFNTPATKMLFGRGLVTNEGESWRRQRHLVQRAFHHHRTAAFAEIVVRSTLAMMDTWSERAARGMPIELDDEMMPLALRIIGMSLFSVDLADRALDMGSAFAEVLATIPPNPPPADPTALHAAVRRLDEIAIGLIVERRRASAPPDDLLSALIAAEEPETGRRLTDEEVRDEVITLLIGGHENSAHALTWTWYLLGNHPDVQRRLHDELMRTLGGRLPDADSAARLQVTRKVVEEAMRLYPPVWAFGRRATEDDEIGGYHIPANASITLSPYAMHRHPSFWRDPDGFDPENFSEAQIAARPRHAYFPFGAGDRVCVGAAFAMLEAELIVATIAQRFEVFTVTDHPVEPATLVTLRPRDGVLVTLRQRT